MAASRRQLPDLDSVLSGDSRTTYRVRANGGKQAALDDIEREMLGEATPGRESESGDSMSTSMTGEGRRRGSLQLDGGTGTGTGRELNADSTLNSNRRAAIPPKSPHRRTPSTVTSGTLPLPDSPYLAHRDTTSTTTASSMARSPSMATNATTATMMSSTGNQGMTMPQKAYEMLGNSSSPVIGTGGGSTQSNSQRGRLPSEAGTLRSSSTMSASDSNTSPPTVASLAAAVESPRLKQQRERERDRALSLATVTSNSDHGSYVHVNGSGHGMNGSSSARDRQPSAANSILRKVRSRDYGQASSATVNTQGLGIENEVERYPADTSSSSSTRKQHKKLVKGSDETYISNAMRKTSGFFRKTFGANASSAQRDPQGISSVGNGFVRGGGASSLSAPNTPTQARFGSSSFGAQAQPPVPSLPSAFAQQGGRAQQQQNGTAAPAGPATPPRASLDAGVYRSDTMRHGSVSSYNTGASPGRPSTSGGGGAASSSKSPSKSLGRISSFAASFRTSQSSNSTTDLGSGERSLKASSSTAGMSEHERLARELHHWQLTEEKMEDMVDQHRERDGGANAGDVSSATIKGKTTPRTPAQQAFTASPPRRQQQQQQTSPRTSGASAAAPVFVSGSLPSPQRGFRGSIASGSGSTGSDGYFRETQSQSRKGSAEDGATSSSTATDETSRQQQQHQQRALSPRAREEPRLATPGGTTPRPAAAAAEPKSLTNPNSSSFWLDSSSSSAAEEDDLDGGQPSPSIGSKDGTGTGAGWTQDVRTPLASAKPVLSPTSGKQVRKRVPSNVKQADGHGRGTMRVISSGSTESERESSPAGETSNAGLGLGIGGLPRDARSGSLSAPAPPDGPFTTPAKLAPSPQLVSAPLPRLTTQSPSPAHPASGSGSAASPSSSGTPSRQVGSIAMYPVGSGSPPSRVLASGVVQGKRSSSGLRTPVIGLPEGDEQPAAAAGTPSSLIVRARTFADRCWNEDEAFLKKDKIAEWLGKPGEMHAYALKFYMDNLDFKGLRLDNAFRKLTEKLYLRAETQQVDRILASFSFKYYQDNPDTVFRDRDVIHAAAYAMLLLNTDLHIADVQTRMSRGDFVQNTMAAIRAQAGSGDARASSVALGTPVLGSGSGEGPDESFTAPSSPSTGQRYKALRTASGAGAGSGSAHSSRTGLNDSAAGYGASSSNLHQQQASPSKLSGTGTALERTSTVDLPAGAGASGSRVASSTYLPNRSWEQEVEATLKEIYAAVKATPIMQPLAYSQLAPPGSGPGSTSPYGSISRTPSRRSQASGMGLGLAAGTQRDVSYKRNSIRGFLGAGSDPMRASSPTPSVGTSRSGGFSNGSTSFGSMATTATSLYPTMGFASNLSHTIIREQQEEDARSDTSDASITDEELALLGAPWAKEGILQKKRYWDAPNKRSKDKNWTQVFSVIEKGEMKMFQFGGSGLAGGHGSGVGGGNWLSNAQVVGEVTLAHSLCSAMPPPGYNRSRPHVLVLSLAGGASYFFQAGTADLVNEWVLTCNYWAGRTSKEPLMGGVSSMDYGWNRVVADGSAAGENEMEDLASVRSGRSGHSRKSRMSYVGSISRHGAGGLGSNDTGMDRITIHDWQPPLPPSTHSTLSEDAQLESLKRHCGALQTELERHNLLRIPMNKLYSSRSTNAARASSNWEKKANYLLSELVKYQIYVEALKVARTERQKNRDEKRVNRLLEEADDGAGIDDPAYSPMPESSATFASAQADVLGGRNEEGARASQDKSTPAPLRRSSVTTATTETTADQFYEANEGRASQDQ